MLDTYRRKRDFSRTSEPKGHGKRRAGSQTFVVQRHRARREHFDFRLEIDGVLKSWAVTRGPSAKPGTRRLAVRTEDHPLEYATFEGVIPPNSYGAGPVMIWDRGGWASDMDPAKALADGHFKFTLTGERMRGQWALVRLAGEEKRENWLLVKDRDAFAEKDDTLAERFETSAVTGRDFAEIIAGGTAKTAAPPPRVPEFVPPMLCATSAIVPEGRDWLYEMKYDGYRLQLAVAGGKAVARTRNGHDWSNRFASIVAAAALLPVKDAILDGEAVVLNERGVSDFPALVSALEAGSPRVEFVAFDILRFNGKALGGEPLHKRRALLEKIVGDKRKPGAIRLAPAIADDGESVLSEIAAAGGEGLIAKRRNAPYVSGRSPAWLKVKVRHREDVVIVGYVPSGKGRGIASLLAAVPEKRKLRYAGRIGTGYSDRALGALLGLLDGMRRGTAPASLIDVADDIPRNVRWVEPRLVAAVRFGGWTAERRMRAAAFLGLREDTPMAAKGAARSSEGGNRAKPRSDEAVKITHSERVVFPKTGFTKGDIADYYRRVAPRMLAHLDRRPVSLLRAPDNVESETFFQRHPMPAMKRGITRLDGAGREARPYMAIEGLSGLMTAVQFGAIEFHGWGARNDAIETPDRVVFDLDPADDVPFGVVREAAGVVRRVMESAGLKCFPLVSGGKGVHVVVPLDASQDWELVEAFAAGIAKRLAQSEPGRFIATASKARRKGRIFIDWLRNKRSATAIVPYSLRARPANTVAVPVSWAGLVKVESADAFHPADVRVGGRDPWEGFFEVRQRIPDGVSALLART